MKRSVKAGKYVPRVAKLEKNKYVAYLDTHAGPLWDMAIGKFSVRICKKRKAAERAALRLIAVARQADHHHKKHAKSPAGH